MNFILIETIVCSLVAIGLILTIIHIKLSKYFDSKENNKYKIYEDDMTNHILKTIKDNNKEELK